MTQAVKSGARGFGEMKLHLAADSPEFSRAYALAAELNVPILIHFQDVDNFQGEGAWAAGFATTFESVLKANPKTMFIGHAGAIWANVSADYKNEAAYPSGPIVRGGVTDRLPGNTPICTAICLPIPATTCSRATPISREISSSAIRTS